MTKRTEREKVDRMGGPSEGKGKGGWRGEREGG